MKQYKKGDKVKLIKSPSQDYPKIYRDGIYEYFQLGTIYTVQSDGEYETSLYTGVKFVSCQQTTLPIDYIEKVS